MDNMKLSGIDIFAGAGGLSEGFIQAGFSIMGTIEKDLWACETQKTRHIFHHLKRLNQPGDYWAYCRVTTSPELIGLNREKIYKKYTGLKEKIEHTIWQAEFGDPEKELGTLSSKYIIKLLEKSAKLHKSDIHFILGGPPCQAYSLVGRSRMGEAARRDRRNFLFKFYYDLVRHFKPEFFLFENVPGIITASGGRIFNMIEEDFDRIGYKFISGNNDEIRKNIQISSNFGIPQSRKRFIFIGIKRGAKLKYPEFSLPISGKEKTTRDAICDLPSLKYNEGTDHGLIEYDDSPNLSDYQKGMREESEGIMNHRARPVNRWYDRDLQSR